ncbi:hypothetical protein AAC387_Pa09g0191 [Persea americana]
MKKTKRQAFGVGAAGAGGVDFISNLPEDIMSSILALVPLRDAVRTSILSKEWRSGFGPSSHIPFIGCLQGTKSLKLKQFYLQYLCVGIVPKKLPATLDRLQYLEVELEFNSKEILAILCISRSSPNLKQLKIKYCVDYKGERYGLLREEDDISGEQAELCGQVSGNIR